MLRNLKIRTKVVGLVAVAVLVIGVVVGNVWMEGRQGKAELRQLEDQVLPLFDASQVNVEHLKDLWVVFERAVLLVAAPETDTVARRELEALHDRLTGWAAASGSADALNLLDLAIAKSHNEKERQQYARIRTLLEQQKALWSRMVTTMQGAVDERLKGRPEGFLTKQAEWRQGFGDFRKLDLELRGEISQTFKTSFSGLDDNLAHGAEVGLWLGLGALILILILGGWIARDIWEQGRGLQEAVSALATAASEISASTTEFASTAAETAASINETTATAEEVKQTARVSHEKSQQMAARAQTTVQTAQAGKKAADETGSLIGRLKDEMATVAATMVTLSEQSQAIGQIIATVDALAEQSNVLAVNAAIEAARAGEQGRGFAVVAQEVKSLAEQSKQGTNQVRTILNDIQKSTGRAVMATEHGSKTVVQGVKQAQDSGEAILSLVRNVEDGAAAATQIALSSQQQMVGVDQVTLAMETIRQAGQQNAASATQLENAAATISDLGHKLQRLTARY